MASYCSNANYNIPFSNEPSLNFDFNIYRTLDEGCSQGRRIENNTFSLPLLTP